MNPNKSYELTRALALKEIIEVYIEETPEIRGFPLSDEERDRLARHVLNIAQRAYDEGYEKGAE